MPRTVVAVVKVRRTSKRTKRLERRSWLASGRFGGHWLDVTGGQMGVARVSSLLFEDCLAFRFGFDGLLVIIRTKERERERGRGRGRLVIVRRAMICRPS